VVDHRDCSREPRRDPRPQRSCAGGQQRGVVAECQDRRGRRSRCDSRRDLFRTSGLHGEDRALFLKRITRPGSKYIPIRRLLEPEQAERIQNLDLSGIGFTPEPRRFHPNGHLASQLIGYISLDSKLGALSGLERVYTKALEGNPGTAIVSKDALKKVFNRRIETAPTAGASLELTIDAQIQSIVERELAAGVKENEAISGSVVVMDPWTGGLYAIANFPTFDFPATGGVAPELLKNAAVEDLFEPGSTFKVVTASAALEDHVVTPDEMIDVRGGQIDLGDGDIVHDTHVSHSLSFTDIIVKSSNVGAILVGQRLGVDRLMAQVSRFRFGTRIGHDFFSQSKGMIADPARLKPRGLARVSMGYLVGVTPLQMAAAVSSVANGGELLEPYVVQKVIRGNEVKAHSKVVLNRTMPADVAAELTTIMEGVVEKGTATQAQIAGFSIAGKTGTAKRLVNGHYSSSEYNASFVGFLPARKPVYTIMVVINTPRGKNGYYGGSVSAPIFKRIAEQLLEYGGIQRTVNPPPPVLVERLPAGGHEVQTSSRAVAPVVTAPAADNGLVPDFNGLNARDALRMMARLGMVSQLRGATGLVVDQRPAAGTRLEPGQKATLWLGRDYGASRKSDTTTQ
jgi:cell division protein FtsI (penicillin-binding protein 3)